MRGRHESESGQIMLKKQNQSKVVVESIANKRPIRSYATRCHWAHNHWIGRNTEYRNTELRNTVATAVVFVSS